MMASQFRNRYLCKYFKDGTDKKLEIWHLGTIDISNPRSNYYQDEVLNAWKEYEMAKTSGNLMQNGLVFYDNCYYLVTECAGIKYASQIFWEKMDEK